MTQTPAVVGATVFVGSYIVGSVPVALLIGRWGGGVDLRALGSGNPGTSNLFRNSGFRLAMLSGPIQFAQGLVPVVVARLINNDGTFAEITAACAIAGNGWPIWLRFNGQRCIAVATGAAAALNPVLLAVLLACFTAGAFAHAIALGVLLGFSVLPIAAAWIGGRGLALTCCVMLVAIVLRRLEGLGADLQRARSGPDRRVVLRRVLLDQRPGQVLVGPRDEPGTVDR